MKLIIILLTVFALFGTCCLSKTPLSPAAIVHSQVNNQDKSGLYWVYFNDKGTSLPTSSLHSSAITRRALKGKFSSQSLELDRDVSKDYIRLVESAGGVVRTQSRWLNAVSISATSDALFAIAQLDCVSLIDPVRRGIKPQKHVGDTLVEVIDVQEFSSSHIVSFPDDIYDDLSDFGLRDLQGLGYSGAGVNVLVLDSGFHKSLSVFDHLTIGGERDFIENDDDTQDSVTATSMNDGHGTSVLSILAGWDPDNYIFGGAPNATLFLAKTEVAGDNTEYAEMDDSQLEEDFFVAGIEWGEAQGVDVALASLGFPALYTIDDADGITAASTIAIDTAFDLGVFSVVALGNILDPTDDGISPPADAFNVVSVAASFQISQMLASNSKGPTRDMRPKPEVFAHGYGVRTVHYDWEARTIQPSAYEVVQKSGTSFAAPIVAAGVALLIEAHPDWTPLQLRQALLEGCGFFDFADSRGKLARTYTGWGPMNISASHHDVVITPNECPNDCYANEGHGTCNTFTKECECADGFLDYDCHFAKVVCLDYCLNGDEKLCLASDDNWCHCKEGFAGMNCDLETQDHIYLESILFSIIYLLTLFFAFIYFIINHKKKRLIGIRVLLFFLLALWYPLWDIMMSRGILGYDVWSFTLHPFNEFLTLAWKFAICIMVFKVDYFHKKFQWKVIFLAVIFSITHLFMAVITAILKKDESDFLDLFTAIKIALLFIVDYAVMPYVFLIWFRRLPELKKDHFITETTHSIFEMQAIEEKSVPSDIIKKESLFLRPRFSFIISIVVLMGLSLLMIDIWAIFNPDAEKSIWVLLFYWIPLLLVMFMDRNKRMRAHFGYFLFFLLMIGDFGLVPIRVVSLWIYQVQDNVGKQMGLSILQLLLMNAVTTVLKRSIRNMWDTPHIPSMVFRYQFLEDFLAMLILLKQDFENKSFWLIAIPQFIWMIARNSGLVVVISERLKNYLHETFKMFDIDDFTLPSILAKNRLNLDIKIRMAQQYLIADFVAIINVPVFWYIVYFFNNIHQRALARCLVNENYDTIYKLGVMYLIILMLRGLGHFISILILRHRINTFNFKYYELKGFKELNSYYKSFSKIFKNYGLYFGVVIIPTTIAAYGAANMLLSARWSTCSAIV